MNVKPGEQTAVQPTPNLPGLSPSTKFSTKNKTDRGSMPQDQNANNFEDVRFRPPSELRGKLMDYNNSLADKVRAGKRAAPASPKNGK